MSDDRSLPANQSNTRSPQLHNSGLNAGSLIDQSLARLSSEQTDNITAKAADAALDLEIKKRTQDINRSAAIQAAKDHIDTFDMLDKGGQFTRQHVASDIKTGAGKMRIESKSGATCFVASVAYGEPNHPDVMFLRSFRDGVLDKSPYGKMFINWYWRNGPKIARIVDKSESMKAASKYIISKIVIMIKKTKHQW